MFLNHLFPESGQGLSHILKHLCDYLLSHVFAAKQQIIRGRSYRLQSKQIKQEKCSCLGWELNPGPFSPQDYALPSEPSHLQQLYISLYICYCCKHSLKLLLHLSIHPSIEDYTFSSIFFAQLYDFCSQFSQPLQLYSDFFKLFEKTSSL